MLLLLFEVMLAFAEWYLLGLMYVSIVEKQVRSREDRQEASWVAWHNGSALHRAQGHLS